MRDDVTRVFVYGTLLRGGANHTRFCNDALAIEPASTQGRLYDLPAGFPAMVEATDGTVYGEAIAFPDIDAALTRLDFLEGYRPERPEHSLYLRRVQPVMLLNSGDMVLAYCYVWRNALPPGATHLPSGKWLRASSRPTQ